MIQHILIVRRDIRHVTVCYQSCDHAAGKCTVVPRNLDNLILVFFFSFRILKLLAGLDFATPEGKQCIVA